MIFSDLALNSKKKVEIKWLFDEMESISKKIIIDRLVKKNQCLNHCF